MVLLCIEDRERNPKRLLLLFKSKSKLLFEALFLQKKTTSNSNPY